MGMTEQKKTARQGGHGLRNEELAKVPTRSEEKPAKTMGKHRLR